MMSSNKVTEAANEHARNAIRDAMMVLRGSMAMGVLSQYFIGAHTTTINAIQGNLVELRGLVDGGKTWEKGREPYDRELARLRQELHQRNEALNGNFWSFQNDGFDHPESLACPVYITAEDLRELFAYKKEAAEAKKELAGCRERLRKSEADLHAVSEKLQYVALSIRTILDIAGPDDKT